MNAVGAFKFISTFYTLVVAFSLVYGAGVLLYLVFHDIYVGHEIVSSLASEIIL